MLARGRYCGDVGDGRTQLGETTHCYGTALLIAVREKGQLCALHRSAALTCPSR